MDEHPVDKVLATAAVIVAAVWAYFSAPVLRYADPAMLSSAGGLLGAGLAGAWMAGRMDWGRRWFVPYALVGVGAAIFLVIQLNVAYSFSDANIARCAALQADMISAQPKRSDSADVFDALGCIPRGTEAIHFPKTQAKPAIATEQAHSPIVSHH